MLSVSDLYNQTRRKIGYELGYVSQQAAGEWASKQVETVGDQITSKRKDKLGREISYLYINTLCLAHEYYIDINRMYRSHNLKENVFDCINDSTGGSDSELISRIQSQVRSLYTRVSFYHGWPGDESGSCLSDYIVELHNTIYAICKEKSIDLAAILPRLIADVRSQDISRRLRFPSGPVISPIIDKFRRIKDESVCVYAKKANAWAATSPPEYEDISNQANFDRFLGQDIDILARLSRATKYENVDSFLLMLPDECGQTVENLANTVESVLSFYSANDSMNVNCMERVGHKEWRYQFGGMNYFVQSFGSCYTSDNTRCTLGINQTFVQLVSEAAFHRAVPPEKWQEARQIIRTAANSTGQPYDVHDHEADTFVHNLRAGMPPIKWHRKK